MSAPIKFFAIMFLLVALQGLSLGMAQSEPTPIGDLPTRLANGQAFLITTGEFIRVFDMETRQIESTARLIETSPSPNLDQPTDISYAIFLLENTPLDPARRSIQSSLVRVDPLTGRRDLLLSGMGYRSLAVSPNQRRAILTYFTGDYGRSDVALCIIDFVVIQADCNYPTLQVAQVVPVQWIDNETFVWLNPDRDFVIGNVVTLEFELISTESVDGYVDTFSVFPNSSRLVIAVPPADIFAPLTTVVLDITTGVFQRVASNGLSGERFHDVGEIHISDDGQYIAYLGLQTAIVEWQNGLLIAELSAQQVEWLPNSNTLIAVRRNEANVSEVISVNAETGHIETLLQTQEGVLLIDSGL